MKSLLALFLGVTLLSSYAQAEVRMIAKNSDMQQVENEDSEDSVVADHRRYEKDMAAMEKYNNHIADQLAGRKIASASDKNSNFKVTLIKVKRNKKVKRS